MKDDPFIKWVITGSCRAFSPDTINRRADHDLLKVYADFASRLYDGSECEKPGIKITAQNWGLYETKLLQFPGIVHQDAHFFQAKEEIYVNAASGADRDRKPEWKYGPGPLRERLTYG